MNLPSFFGPPSSATACPSAASHTPGTDPAGRFDVVIYGGTSAGVIAAVQAARLGRKVALVEPGRHFGGMSVEGLGSSDIDNKPDFKNSIAIGGLAAEFYRRIGRAYGEDRARWIFEPHVAEQVVDVFLAEQSRHITLLRGHRLREPLVSAVGKDGTAITALHCDNGVTVHGRVFVDATFEGDLLAAAGVETIIGRESNIQYGESKNGIRAETIHAQFKIRVDPYRIPGSPRSGVIATIQDEPFGTPGEGDHRIQAYCFRLCLTKESPNRVPFVKPPGYEPSSYEIYRRYAQAGGKLWTPYEQLPNGKTDLGSWHDLSANLYGQNHGYPGGDYQTRERIRREHLLFTQGLCWFLAHDPVVPESVRREWQQWGTCRDEFPDNDGWPRQFYVRDARRMVSDLVLTELHTRRHGATPVAEPVAVAFWPTDTHSVRRIVRAGAAYNEGFVFDDDEWGPFRISYRALVPRRRECTNLLTPTCPSSSHVAYGAIRLEWTFMALGQAAGTAAVMALDRACAVQDVDYVSLRDRLRRDGQVLEIENPFASRSDSHDSVTTRSGAFCGPAE